MATTLKEDLKQVRDCILDLYLDVKVRSNEELNGLDEAKLIDERKKLQSVGTKVIVDYIRSSIEILLNLKMEDQNELNQSSKGDISITSNQTSKIMHMRKQPNRETPSRTSDLNQIINANCSDTDRSMTSSRYQQTTSQIGYEEQMQQYEADIRNHISIEQQLKIYIDNLKYKMECEEKEFLQKEASHQDQISSLQKDKQRLDELMVLKDKEITTLKEQIKELKDQIQSLEARNQKQKREVENNFKSQINQIQEELERFKNAYHTNAAGNRNQVPLNNQNYDPVNQQSYQTIGDHPSQAMQLINFYHPQDDQALININSNGSKLVSATHRKNQLSLQSSKSNNKLIPTGYIQTASTHQSTQGQTPQVNQTFQHLSSMAKQPSSSMMMGNHQSSFTNPRNSTNADPSRLGASSAEMSKSFSKKALLKNHSEYFVTNPHVKELVESTQKSFRNKAQQLTQGLLGKKSSVTRSPEKGMPKSNLYKMTMQKSQERFQSIGTHQTKRLSQKPSKERIQVAHNSSSSLNQSSTGTHRRAKTGINNQWITSALASSRQPPNITYNRSRENSQSIGRSSAVMPANNQAYSFIKNSNNTSTLQGSINAMLASGHHHHQHIENYEIIDENTHKLPKHLVHKEHNSNFQSLNEEQVMFQTQDRSMFEKTLVSERIMDGGTQNIKSMKNLKATILGNSQHVKGAAKFKMNDKDTNPRNPSQLLSTNVSRLTESQADSLKKMSQSIMKPSSQQSAPHSQKYI